MCKRKLLALLLACSLLMGLAACSNTAATEPAGTPEQTAAEAPETTAVPATTAAPETEAPETEVPETGKETEAEPETAGSYNSKEAALPYEYSNGPKNAASAEENAPRIMTLESGVQIQTVPDDDRGWNNVYLDADNRGCNACHILEDIAADMSTYHEVIYYKYPTTYTLATCVACHSFYKTPLRDSIHGIHMGNAAFQAMNGSCQSCHYIDGDGNYERWDYVKYDHLAGITDVAAEDVKVDISYDQNVITPIENMFFKCIKVVNMEPDQWYTDDSQLSQDIIDQWEITVSGDVDNPFTMKLNDMVEQFGTVTQVMSSQCCINGAGESMIFQVEVTGIPLERIFEYAGVHDDVTTFDSVGYDTYGSGKNHYPMNYDFVMENDGILVTQINGQPFPANQGGPCATWVYNASSGNNVKCITELIATKQEDPAHWALVGDFVDPATGEVFSKPNIGVLSTPSGTIFPAGETVHLEGYADAWDEPILSMEYSFDHGETWVKVETPDNSSRLWTYWTMDFTPDAPGSYLLRMRATSLTNQGEERVSNICTDFLINVK